MLLLLLLMYYIQKNLKKMPRVYIYIFLVITLPEFAGRHRVGLAGFDPFHFDWIITGHITLQSSRVSFFGGNRSCGRREQRRS